MKVTETKLKGCFIIEPNVFKDERGYFFESFNHKNFCEAIGQEVTFVQDNQSHSKKGVLRGLHFQKGEHAQAKLVCVLDGNVLDVAVDLREDSPTYGQYVSIELSSENKKQLFVPRGFAHGFVVLSDTAHFFYKCDNYYNKASEGGVKYDDPFLGIDWRLGDFDPIVSKKDLELKRLKHI
ncbi:dTDP-4-dehydrorhamnose 3,5-epimerase [Flagellimonas pelagia]|uniref:dTDP-4-dehydrorhamnose 3,5-epimerase n=1 Tax=Flagellimonas pelagia TaxID=2306998 RepID=A0A3A1NLQ2_9FLAO|nr:dTDP-4-dehydrorhamnose 3,5-epimerase [Allomuricauda maritima]RIV44617.1 dTDP-4-dehydrorhamnose 3,5-epimerase [Allomuricauda maritima]TXJ94679.1 dTDP-4-dehydrorhamnose 3,5-epimerase [Allomuricauda maritima]